MPPESIRFPDLKFRIVFIVACISFLSTTPVIANTTASRSHLPEWIVLVLQLVSENHVIPTTGIVVSAEGKVLVPLEFTVGGHELLVLDGGSDPVRFGRPAKIEKKMNLAGMALLSVDGLKRAPPSLSARKFVNGDMVQLLAFPPAELIAVGEPPVFRLAEINLGSNGTLQISAASDLPNLTGALVDGCDYLVGMSAARGLQGMDTGRSTSYYWTAQIEQALQSAGIKLGFQNCNQTLQLPVPVTISPLQEPEPPVSAADTATGVGPVNEQSDKGSDEQTQADLEAEIVQPPAQEEIPDTSVEPQVQKPQTATPSEQVAQPTDSTPALSQPPVQPAPPEPAANQAPEKAPQQPDSGNVVDESQSGAIGTEVDTLDETESGGVESQVDDSSGHSASPGPEPQDSADQQTLTENSDAGLTTGDDVTTDLTQIDLVEDKPESDSVQAFDSTSNNKGGQSLQSQVDVKENPTAGFSTWVWFALAAFIVLLATMILLLKRKKKPDQQPNEVQDSAYSGFLLVPKKPNPAWGALRLPVISGVVDVTVGRYAADIIINEKSISRKHAKLTGTHRLLRIVDLGSTNGTQINGVSCVSGEAVVVSPGDEITLGSIVFVLETGLQSGN